MMREKEGIFTMKLAGFALIFMALLPMAANAHNLYKEGTEGDKLSRIVSMISDSDAIPFFVNRKHPSFYSSHIDQDKVKDIDLPLARIQEALELGAMSEHENGRMSLLRLDESDKRVCMISFFKDKVSIDTFIHEALHCKTSKYWNQDQYIDLAARAYAQTKPSVSPQVYMNYFEEALVAHLTVAYAANTNLDGSGRITMLSKLDRNVQSSIGMRMARSAINLCSERGACSLDVMTIARQMVGSPGFKEDLKKDAEDLSAMSNLSALGISQ